MAHRVVLTERQRSVLFALATDEQGLLRHYTLADDDLAHIQSRRRPRNRFGFALQLCAFRYPGRLLNSGEVVPKEVVEFLAAQLGARPDDLLTYAAREETRREHLIALRQISALQSVRRGHAVPSAQQALRAHQRRHHHQPELQ